MSIVSNLLVFTQLSSGLQELIQAFLVWVYKYVTHRDKSDLGLQKKLTSFRCMYQMVQNLHMFEVNIYFIDIEVLFKVHGEKMKVLGKVSFEYQWLYDCIGVFSYCLFCLMSFYF